MGEDDYGQYMHVKDPVVLAALVAFCSGNHHRVLLRGCCRNFPKSFPSLFRDQDSFCGDAEKRWSAYRCVLRKLKECIRSTRQRIASGTGPSTTEPSCGEGDVTLWLTPDAIATWAAAGVGRRSGQLQYSDLAIETALTLSLIFH